MKSAKGSYKCHHAVWLISVFFLEKIVVRSTASEKFPSHLNHSMNVLFFVVPFKKVQKSRYSLKPLHWKRIQLHTQWVQSLQFMFGIKKTVSSMSHFISPVVWRKLYPCCYYSLPTCRSLFWSEYTLHIHDVGNTCRKQINEFWSDPLSHTNLF